MPGQLSISSPLPTLGQTRPNMPSLVGGRAITSDGDVASNSGRAAGADLITKVLQNTGPVNGLGGEIDVLV
ncbi:MAG: hypothetical protein O2954_19180 [bacterium]|nr:hypothetical protein [bacterium]